MCAKSRYLHSVSDGADSMIAAAIFYVVSIVVVVILTANLLQNANNEMRKCSVIYMIIANIYEHLHNVTSGTITTTKSRAALCYWSTNYTYMLPQQNWNDFVLALQRAMIMMAMFCCCCRHCCYCRQCWRL